MHLARRLPQVPSPAQSATESWFALLCIRDLRVDQINSCKAACYGSALNNFSKENTMRKSIYFSPLPLMLCMFSSLCAVGQERQLERVNPDGSVATDSVAIAVIAPRVYLNEQLEQPSPK